MVRSIRSNESMRSRHEDDNNVAHVLRGLLCKSGGAAAHCTVGATERRHGFSVRRDGKDQGATKKAKGGSKRKGRREKAP